MTRKWRSICLHKYECSCKDQIPHFNLMLASFFLLKNESESWNNFLSLLFLNWVPVAFLLSFTQLRSAELLTQGFNFEFTKPCSIIYYWIIWTKRFLSTITSIALCFLFFHLLYWRGCLLQENILRANINPSLYIDLTV